MPIPNQRKVSRAVYLIFTKKYGLHIQPDASRYLEELLREEANVNDALEKIVKMYQKRNEGKYARQEHASLIRRILTMLPK
jgi:DNA polymerase epsilon subunit 2